MSQPDTRRNGLSTSEALAQLARFGPNALPESPRPHLLLRFLTQFQSPLIYILLIALVLDALIWAASGAAGMPVESIAIGLILMLNAGLGVYQEGKSEAALSRLKEMAAPLSWVHRDGEYLRLPAAELVPDDLVRVEAGDRVPADGEIVSADVASVDESVLTGESLPVERSDGDELFSGTLLVRGRALFRVTRTGSRSATGRLAEMIGSIETGKTPLEARLDVFAAQISRAILGLAILILVAGVIVEGFGRIGHVLVFAVALAVAAIPEGLPAVLTLTLALGVERMARRKAVVRRLSAVEALGSVTVIVSDKTGTLTENRMFVRRVDALDDDQALRAMILANDADDSASIGDPLELALIAYAGKCGVSVSEMRCQAPRCSAVPFDSSYKFMRATVTVDGDTVSYLKGAPEVLLARSTLTPAAREEWHRRIEDMACQGSRVLALGYRKGEGETEVEFLGTAELWDPPRGEVRDAIRQAGDAGIRVVMATGDHPVTAAAIAREIGLPSSHVITGRQVDEMSEEELAESVSTATVFARVTPEHKLRLVESLKASGEVVAMTGDGVNDAPALKRSDVGIAMGNRGSDVSREVADLVLLDDNFATIVAAIEEGRNIYENIQKFIRFLFSTNFALVLLVVGGAFGSFLLGLTDEAGGLLLPLTAVQLLWINILADGPPALALGLDRNPHVMRRQPRRTSQPLLDGPSLRFIFSTGLIKAVLGGALLVFLPRLGYSLLATRSGVFLFESMAQLVMAYPSRKITAAPQGNPALHVTVAVGALLALAALYMGPLQDLLGLEPVNLPILTLIAAAVMITWVVGEMSVKIDRKLWSDAAPGSASDHKR